MSYVFAGFCLPSPAAAHAMIRLTQLGGDAFVLNAELIKYIETRPDTIVTLTNGERLVVRETMSEVVRGAIDYQRTKHLFPNAEDRLPWTSRLSAASAEG